MADPTDEQLAEWEFSDRKTLVAYPHPGDVGHQEALDRLVLIDAVRRLRADYADALKVLQAPGIDVASVDRLFDERDRLRAENERLAPVDEHRPGELYSSLDDPPFLRDHPGES